MKTVLSYIVLSLFFVSTVWAQVPNRDNKNIVYYNDFSVGARLNTLGWGIYTDFGKQLTVNKRRVYRIEITEQKHGKEFRRPSPTTSSGIGGNNTKTYFFGKQNNFYTVNFSLGRNRLIAEKAYKNGVAIYYSYAIGPTLGLLKPYYLDVEVEQTPGNPVVSPTRYDPGDPEGTAGFLNEESIKGSSGFRYGIDEIKFRPGLHGKFGINFDWAAYDDVVKQIEVGMTIDAFIKKVPIMITEKNHQFFANLYVSFQMGRRW